MNADIVKGKWKQWRGGVKKLWGRITDDRFEIFDGEQDQLNGMIQERAGRSRSHSRRRDSVLFD